MIDHRRIEKKLMTICDAFKLFLYSNLQLNINNVSSLTLNERKTANSDMYTWYF